MLRGRAAMCQEAAQESVPRHGTGIGTAGVGPASPRASSSPGAICSAAAVSDSRRVRQRERAGGMLAAGGGPSVTCQPRHLHRGSGRRRRRWHRPGGRAQPALCLRVGTAPATTATASLPCPCHVHAALACLRCMASTCRCVAPAAPSPSSQTGPSPAGLVGTGGIQDMGTCRGSAPRVTARSWAPGDGIRLPGTQHAHYGLPGPAAAHRRFAGTRQMAAAIPGCARMVAGTDLEAGG